jgi:adenine-specific DNA-methyltransferase
VPAEIGHAPYAIPLIEHLIERFSVVHIVAVRSKLFPGLSEDCWLLYAEGLGGRATNIRFTSVDQFTPTRRPPLHFQSVSLKEWRVAWNRRLRPFLISGEARDLYREIAARTGSRRFGELASINIGYVSGANHFFHLRPSDVHRWEIPENFVHPTVRNGRVLPRARLTAAVVEKWKQNDDQILLLRLPKTKDLPRSVYRYLETDAAHVARTSYKCRMRDPWYSVPDVKIPDFFLSYMSGREPSLVRNDANCTCTNSVHSVRIKKSIAETFCLESWGSPFVKLSCEIEGHPLGGGMLKLEPREAAQILLPAKNTLSPCDHSIIKGAIEKLRVWRHYAASD